MTLPPLEKAYFEWLQNLVHNNNRYEHLLRQLFTTEFVWFIRNDENRADDGCELRHVFLVDCDIPEYTDEWMDQGCSLLEMLIALSQRLSFDTDRLASWWFWRLLHNLSLDTFSEKAYVQDFKGSTTWVRNRANWFMYRNFHHDGQGGLFPLENAYEDQRSVEIWYQMSAYLIEYDCAN